MARASSWLGCLVEGAAESGRRAMKDASGAERTGTGPFHISPACCRTERWVASGRGHKPPRTAALGDPTWAHQPVGHGWPYWALAATAVAVLPGARRLD